MMHAFQAKPWRATTGAPLFAGLRVAGVVWVCGGISGFAWRETNAEQQAFARSEELEASGDWAAAAAHDVAIWVDGIGQPAGRALGFARELVKRMAFETYVQEKEPGQPIPLDPPAFGRLEALQLPILAIAGLLDESSVPAAARALEERAGARRIELADVAHMPSLEKPKWFTETLLGFLGEVHPDDAGARP